MRKTAREGLKGRRGLAAVLMVVMPFLENTEAPTAVIDQKVIWERSMPTAVSTRISRMRPREMHGPTRGGRPSAASSSTSSEACQKNM